MTVFDGIAINRKPLVFCSVLTVSLMVCFRGIVSLRPQKLREAGTVTVPTLTDADPKQLRLNNCLESHSWEVG